MRPLPPPRQGKRQARESTHRTVSSGGRLAHRAPANDRALLPVVVPRRSVLELEDQRIARELSEKYREMVPRIEDDFFNVLTENGRYVDGIIGRPNGLAKKALEEGALAAGITGTGPATAVIVPKGEGERMADALGCKVILSRTRC